MVIQPTQSPLLTPVATGSVVSANASASGGFGSLLEQALGSVNQSVANSMQQGLSLASGTAPNIANVMISATQAQLAVDLTVQVRDRVIGAYNQIMNMQV